ncbi:MAG TPA: DUF2165 domain-containing protein [Methylocystis sp.]|nr:DUF2165 domain-containing protein [Methylocystis sp.]
MILRHAKIFLVACTGVLMAIVSFDNIFDYGTNFACVQHILAMDTLGPDTAFTWRAITSAPLHHLAYALIIGTELAAAALCLAGTTKLYRARASDGRVFDAAKGIAILGLVVAFSLYFLGFMAIGGEWFEMWRSQGWNMQEAAFRFIGAIGIVLLLVAQSDAERG